MIGNSSNELSMSTIVELERVAHDPSDSQRVEVDYCFSTRFNKAATVK